MSDEHHHTYVLSLDVTIHTATNVTELAMILPSALMLGTHLLTPVADRVPVLNVEQVCQGIAQQGGSSFHDPAIAKEREDCVASEKEVREQLVERWSSFPAADRRACTAESEMGGDSSYTELLTCLEMARDVRDTHGTSAAPSAGPSGR
jgi:hypothetical protein